MRLPKNLISTINNQQGVVAILVCFAMLFLISFAALAVDIGYILTTKNELQNIADAAALSAARKLREIYAIPRIYYSSSECSDDCISVKDAAQSVASMNWAGGENGGITILDSEIVIGTWSNGGFTETHNYPHATKIIARRRDDISNSNLAVSTFFAKLLGINSVDIQAMAIAAMPPVVISDEDAPDVSDPPVLVK